MKAVWMEWSALLRVGIRSSEHAMVDNGSTHLLLVFEFFFSERGADGSRRRRYVEEEDDTSRANACDVLGSRR